MKRLTAFILVILLNISLFAGCARNNSNEENNQRERIVITTTNNLTAGNASTGSAQHANTDITGVKGEIKTGLGIITSIASSKPATAEAAGTAQVESSIVAVTVDANGIITKCEIDVIQSRVSFDASGKITSDTSVPVKTKQERKEDYGMRKASPIGKEWYEQANAFSAWCIGKTVEEVTGLSTEKVNEPNIADIPDLAASVTITMDEFLEAFEKVGANTQGAIAESAYKTGIGIVTSLGSSKDATADAAGVGQVESSIAIVTIDGSGKIIACLIDSAQTKVNFDANGLLLSDLTVLAKTKQARKDDYGMRKSSQIGKEWFEQADAFSAWCIGKTVEEVTGLSTERVDEPNIADIPDLAASVTMDMGGFIEAIEKAVTNAR